MHFFTEYIQPLTLWLYSHPHCALFITFLVSFSESLAIVGSIIPGSVTMTAIGILAGSGIMRIDLTFIAAALGAIAGDTCSYGLGYTFSDRLTNIWPFSRYPKWLDYGQSYFKRHGSTSVLIGRFFGPMRSIIPVIAGMMHMNHWHFLLANITSGIAWAILYVAPGVLIGAASSELSTESATRLFMLILILLIIVWLVSVGIKWLIIRTNQFLHIQLHLLWIRLQNYRLTQHYAKALTPSCESNHYSTAALLFLFILGLVMTVLMLFMIFQSTLANGINIPVYLFLQSLRTPILNAFFIILSLIISPLSLLTCLLSFMFYALYYQDWRLLKYWLSLALTSSLMIFFLIYMTGNQDTGEQLLIDEMLQLLSTIDLTLATALFCFFIFYINHYFHTITLLTLRIILLIILSLAGIGFIYLGDNWLTNVMASYFIGLTLGLIHWIFYRRKKDYYQRSQKFLIWSLLFFALTACVSNRLYFSQQVQAHAPQLAQYVITEKAWWSQQQHFLPVYITNRIGKRTGLFNIQYAGSVTTLTSALEAKGWKPQSNSLFYSLLLRASGKNSETVLPLMTQLYFDRKPTLIMTYHPNNAQYILILKLWRSNYHLRHYQQPIWLGNLVSSPQKKRRKAASNQTITVHNYLVQSLPDFKFNPIWLPKAYLKILPYPSSRILLLIKQPEKSK